MLCPSCKDSVLKPVKLAVNLPARKCVHCRGVLIDLLSYRAWRDHWLEQEVAALPITEVPDHSKAMLCPKCSRLMLKFRISGRQPNMIDVCAICDEAWLDEGEWELLEALSLQKKLTAIFTEPWQRRIREERTEEQKAQRLEKLIGKNDLKKVNEVASWIEKHPKKEVVLRILAEKIHQSDCQDILRASPKRSQPG